MAQGLLLAVDAGNTQTVFGLYEGGELLEHWRVWLAARGRKKNTEPGALSSTAPTDFPQHPCE